MKFKIPLIFIQNAPTFWLGITLLFWWLGIAGRDLYIVPAIVCLGTSAFQIRKGNFSNNSIYWLYEYSNKKYFYAIYWVHVGIFLVTTILKYYSFKWNVWDAGNYSNMLFNISRGQFYSSYFDVHNWGDHFTPSMTPLAIFYFWIPSIHWLTLAKTFSYLSVPILIYKICKDSILNKENAWTVTLIIGAFWILFYSPALNSLYYEFQPSALAHPFILYAFLCFQRKKWLFFWITMIILLGFKEHLGSVWIGFGCFIILNTKFKKTGLLLIGVGVVAIYLIMFHIMPFFRNYEESWSMPIGPFHDYSGKLIYLLKMLIPLGFLPLIFWRVGVLAGPAIGVNLLSSNPSMYSTSYHYDDISSTLLIISLISIFSNWDFKNLKFRGRKKFKECLLISWFLISLSLIPSSPLRELYKSIPEDQHWLIRDELINFDIFSKDQSIAVQTSLGPHFNRKEISAITQDSNGKCAPRRRDKLIEDTKFLIFAKSLNHYLIDDLEKCINLISFLPEYKKLHGYRHLNIFMNSK
tara:strand:+ start:809 stop:2377 length:1569 start_codon:yes stop_codon:yes gene_type:complete